MDSEVKLPPDQTSISTPENGKESSLTSTEKGFGIVSLLHDSADIYYNTILTAKQLGRASDLLASQLKGEGIDELKLRCLFIFSVFLGFLKQSDQANASIATDFRIPIVIECGSDKERIAIGASFNLPKEIGLLVEGIDVRIQSGNIQYSLERLLADCRKYSDQLCFKYHPMTGRAEVTATWLRGSERFDREGTFEVILFKSNELPPGRKPNNYIDLGDIDFEGLLSDRVGSRADNKKEAQGSNAVEAETVKTNQKVIMKGGRHRLRGPEDQKQKEASGSEEDDSEVRIESDEAEEDDSTSVRSKIDSKKSESIAVKDKVTSKPETHSIVKASDPAEDEESNLVQGSDDPDEEDSTLVKGKSESEGSDSRLVKGSASSKAKKLILKNGNSEIDSGGVEKFKSLVNNTKSTLKKAFSFFNSSAAEKSANTIENTEVSSDKEKQEEDFFSLKTVQTSSKARAQEAIDEIDEEQEEVEEQGRQKTKKAKTLEAEQEENDEEENQEGLSARKTKKAKGLEAEQEENDEEENQEGLSARKTKKAKGLEAEQEENGEEENQEGLGVRKTKKAKVAKLNPEDEADEDQITESTLKNKKAQADQNDEEDEKLVQTEQRANSKNSTSTSDDEESEEDVNSKKDELDFGSVKLSAEFDKVQADALVYQKNVKDPKVSIWMNGLMEKVTQEKARLVELSKEMHQRMRAKETEFKKKLTTSQEEVKRLQSTLLQKEVALARNSETLAQMSRSIEKFKAQPKISANEAQLKSKYLETLRKVTAYKDQNVKLTQKVDELRKKVNTNAAAPKTSENYAVKHEGLLKKYEALSLQAEEYKKQNMKLVELFHKTKKENEAKKKNLTTVSPFSTSEISPDISRKLEAAIQNAETSKKEADQAKGQVELMKSQEARLKAMLSSLQSEVKNLKQAAAAEALKPKKDPDKAA